MGLERLMHARLMQINGIREMRKLLTTIENEISAEQISTFMGAKESI